MSAEHTWQNYSQLLAEVVHLCQQKASGSLFCTTDTSESATITVKQGQIIAIGYRNLQGLAALSQLQNSQQWRFRFTPNFILPANDDLPGTSDILQALGAEDQPQLPIQNHQTQPPTPISTEIPSRQSLPVAPEQLREIIEKQALNIFGPIGKLLCDEQFSFTDNLPITSQDQLKQFLRTMVDSSGAPETMQPFIDGVFQQLQLTKLNLPEHSREDNNTGTLRIDTLQASISADQLREIIAAQAEQVFGSVGISLCAKQFAQNPSIASRDDLRRILRAIVESSGSLEKIKPFIEGIFKQANLDERRFPR